MRISVAVGHGLQGAGPSLPMPLSWALRSRPPMASTLVQQPMSMMLRLVGSHPCRPIRPIQTSPATHRHRSPPGNRQAAQPYRAQGRRCSSWVARCWLFWSSLLLHVQALSCCGVWQSGCGGTPSWRAPSHIGPGASICSLDALQMCWGSNFTAPWRNMQTSMVAWWPSGC